MEEEIKKVNIKQVLVHLVVNLLALGFFGTAGWFGHEILDSNNCNQFILDNYFYEDNQGNYLPLCYVYGNKTIPYTQIKKISEIDTQEFFKSIPLVQNNNLNDTLK